MKGQNKKRISGFDKRGRTSQRQHPVGASEDSDGVMELEKRISIISKFLELDSAGYAQKKKRAAALSVTSNSQLQTPEKRPVYTNLVKDHTEEALKELAKSYQLFDALDGLEAHNLDEFLKAATEVSKFTGVFRIIRVDSEQCVVCEILGLDSKHYFLIVEKKLTPYFPDKFFQSNHLYFFSQLVINFVKRERLIVFLIDQQTKGKLLYLLILSFH